MCGRFALVSSRMTPEEFQARFGFPMPPQFQTPYSFNIPPYQDVPVIFKNAENQVELRDMFWQLIPAFAKSFKSEFSMFNSRAESFEKKGYKQQLLSRSRCLIPANYFFEWVKKGKEKIPFRFGLKSDRLMTFGGIYSIWRDENGENLYSCSVITVPANKTVEPVHKRMPFILELDKESVWLDTQIRDIDLLSAMMQPFQADEMQVVPVSNAVNSTRNDNPQLIEPL